MDCQRESAHSPNGGDRIPVNKCKAPLPKAAHESNSVHLISQMHEERIYVVRGIAPFHQVEHSVCTQYALIVRVEWQCHQSTAVGSATITQR